MLGVERLAAALREGGGLEVVRPFSVARYNRVVQEQRLGLRPLPTAGKQDCVGVLVGNSKEIWGTFLDWLDGQPLDLLRADPLDTFVKRVVKEAVDQSFEDGDGENSIFWATDSGDRLVALQRIAELSGLACLDLNTHLCIHPEFGAWFSLRAAIVLLNTDVADVEQLGICHDPPLSSEVLLTQTERDTAQELFQAALKAANEQDSWNRWLAVRDSVTLGREHRFSDKQIRYHYCKDSDVLERLWRERRLSASNS
jgi:methylmalonic aciduria homocystinuria type C protein